MVPYGVKDACKMMTAVLIGFLLATPIMLMGYLQLSCQRQITCIGGDCGSADSVRECIDVVDKDDEFGSVKHHALVMAAATD